MRGNGQDPLNYLPTGVTAEIGGRARRRGIFYFIADLEGSVKKGVWDWMLHSFLSLAPQTDPEHSKAEDSCDLLPTFFPLRRDKLGHTEVGGPLPELIFTWEKSLRLPPLPEMATSFHEKFNMQLLKHFTEYWWHCVCVYVQTDKQTQVGLPCIQALFSFPHQTWLG